VFAHILLSIRYFVLGHHFWINHWDLFMAFHKDLDLAQVLMFQRTEGANYPKCI